MKKEEIEELISGIVEAFNRNGLTYTTEQVVRIFEASLRGENK